MEIDRNLIKYWAGLVNESCHGLFMSEGATEPNEADAVRSAVTLAELKDDPSDKDVEDFIVANIAEGSIDEYLKNVGPTQLILGTYKDGTEARNGGNDDKNFELPFEVTYASLGLGKPELLAIVKEWASELPDDYMDDVADFEYDILDDLLWDRHEVEWQKWWDRESKKASSY